MEGQCSATEARRGPCAAAELAPYMDEIRLHTSSVRLKEAAKELKSELEQLVQRKFVTDNLSVINSWRGRIEVFRENKKLIALRVYPFTRVPDLLYGENRNIVLETEKVQRAQLKRNRRLNSTKWAIDQFFEGKLTRIKLNREWNQQLTEAATKIQRHKKDGGV